VFLAERYSIIERVTQKGCALMTTPGSPTFLCCDGSRQAGEQLFATATEVKVWLLLEHYGAWGAKAFEESDLPQPIKTHLSAQLAAIPGSRLQLIRQDRGRRAISYFIAEVNEPESVLYRFDLSGYDELLDLDAAAILAVGDSYQQYRIAEPVFTVCTNGRRDASCAHYGPVVYQRFMERVGEAAWQTTHIGGHRFAATCVCHPYGVIYGRIPPERAVEIVEETRRRRIVLDLYRGRSFYPPEVQAADYYLREQTGVLDLADFRLLDTERIAEDVSSVRFEALADRQVYRVQVLKDPAGVKTYQNSSDAEPALAPQFRLLKLERVSGA
jgi:hypothetical protein